MKNDYIRTVMEATVIGSFVIVVWIAVIAAYSYDAPVNVASYEAAGHGGLVCFDADGNRTTGDDWKECF